MHVEMRASQQVYLDRAIECPLKALVCVVRMLTLGVSLPT
jgi:hypothetical protein